MLAAPPAAAELAAAGLGARLGDGTPGGADGLGADDGCAAGASVSSGFGVGLAGTAWPHAAISSPSAAMAPSTSLEGLPAGMVDKA
jgi:hypothetical protein